MIDSPKLKNPLKKDILFSKTRRQNFPETGVGKKLKMGN